MLKKVRTRALAAVVIPVLAVALTGCDIVTADFKAQETTEWRRSYELTPGGRVEIVNVNGKIDVKPSTGQRVEIVAVKLAKAATADAARQVLEKIEIAESATPDAVRVETKVPRQSGLFNMGGTEVRYTVSVPAGTESHVRTTNGGLELSGLSGRLTASTTNGGIHASAISGPIEASTTNGGIEVEVTEVLEPGIRLECTNGGIRLRLPSNARATINASITNGGIQADDLNLEKSESSRRRLEARLNGGGPPIRISGTNGGIRISGR